MASYCACDMTRMVDACLPLRYSPVQRFLPAQGDSCSSVPMVRRIVRPRRRRLAAQMALAAGCCEFTPARFRLGPKCAVSADEASVIPGYTHSREDCHLRA